MSLTGCANGVLDPAGPVGAAQRTILFNALAVMLAIVVPTMIATVVFAWWFRAGNKRATYRPSFVYSGRIELIVWSIPILVILFLGGLIWVGSHQLDPYRPLPSRTRPLEVQVVSLDWKWLFIYPELGIATVNEMAAPVDQPISFKLTSSSVWNTFYVPALAGMIYTMPGMETQLQAVINREGDYWGQSAQYSGSGFSRMNFRFHGLSREGFEQWVAKVRAGGERLEREAYLRLEKPSEAEPVRYYASVENGLFGAILGMCVTPGQMCVDEMHHIDRSGGAGKDSEGNRERLDYDNRRLESGNEPSGATFPASGRPPQGSVQPEGMMPRDQGMSRGGVNQRQPEPDQGQGNALPGADREPAPAQLNSPPTENHQH